MNLEICRRVWEILLATCRAESPNEIGGFLHVESTGTTLRIRDTEPIKCATNSAHIEFDEEDLLRILKHNKLWPGQEHGTFPVWGLWHSHPTFNPFWSSIDERMMVASHVGRGLLVNVCLNNEGSHVARVDTLVGDPSGRPTDKIPITTNLPLKIENPWYEDLDSIVKSFKEAVTRPVVPGYLQTPETYRELFDYKSIEDYKFPTPIRRKQPTDRRTKKKLRAENRYPQTQPKREGVLCGQLVHWTDNFGKTWKSARCTDAGFDDWFLEFFGFKYAPPKDGGKRYRIFSIVGNSR